MERTAPTRRCLPPVIEARLHRDRRAARQHVSKSEFQTQALSASMLTRSGVCPALVTLLGVQPLALASASLSTDQIPPASESTSRLSYPARLPIATPFRRLPPARPFSSAECAC